MARQVGLVLGKFMPPHLGHMLLCKFAQNYADDLVIVVGSVDAEEPIIPGKLRYEWMKKLFPDAKVVHLHENLPQQPSEHADFWNLWKDALNKVIPSGYTPDLVFASESYASELASNWGARHVLVDPERDSIKISGTAVRNDPIGNWDYLPQVVRPYFLKKVCIVGPESTGKSILAKELAAHYGTTFVPEFAKGYIETTGWPKAPEDMERIIHGQMAMQRASEELANRVLVCDSDPLTTRWWSEVLFKNRVSDVVKKAAHDNNYDLYLLTAPNTGWVADVHRQEGLVDRQAFFTRAKTSLQALGRKFVVIDAEGWDARRAQAIQAVDEIVHSKVAARPALSVQVAARNITA